VRAGTAEAAEQTYFPIALATLAPGSVVPCELWLRHGRGEPVLYRARHLDFTMDHRARLSASGVETLYVPFSDSGAWTAYIEQRLHERIADPGIPVAQRVEVLLEASRPILREILADPRKPGAAKRVGTVADAVCELMRGPETVAAAVRLMEHDYYTYTHSLHVAIFAVSLSRACGIDAPDVLASIGRGALMHDCGKVKLPAHIINKPGRLDRDEWEQMMTHPTHGRDILREAGWNDPIASDVCHCHHERLDGTGYPRGLVGQAIPEAARIAAICDAYDAMTSDRSYKRAMHGARALSCLRRDECSRYDQEILEKFIPLLATRS
jgi:HD-GYP domain-containing protein (c-di-GMP phosphodiesterase class II)